MELQITVNGGGKMGLAVICGKGMVDTMDLLFSSYLTVKF
jgi:hypothetical protein